MKKIILIILTALVSLFIFNYNVEAKTATCVYNIGSNNTYLEVNVDSAKESVSAKITGTGASVMGISGVNLSYTNFTRTGTTNLFCLSQLHVLGSYSGGRATNYSITYLVTSGYSAIPLISSKSSVDNSVGANESKLTAIRNCSYTGVVISYMSDGTLKYSFKGAYTGYQKGATDITPNDFKDSCLANVYIVSSGGRGGNYAAVYKSSKGGQSSSLNSAGEELTGDQIEDYYDYGESSNPTNYIEQADVLLPFCVETAKIWKMLGYLINALKLLVPVLIIVLGSLDLGKAVVAQSEDDIKKGTQLLIKRIIAGIIIFFLPIVIMLVFKMVYDRAPSASGGSVCIDCVAKPWNC